MRKSLFTRRAVIAGLVLVCILFLYLTPGVRAQSVVRQPGSRPASSGLMVAATGGQAQGAGVVAPTPPPTSSPPVNCQAVQPPYNCVKLVLEWVIDPGEIPVYSSGNFGYYFANGLSVSVALTMQGGATHSQGEAFTVVAPHSVVFLHASGLGPNVVNVGLVGGSPQASYVAYGLSG